MSLSPRSGAPAPLGLALTGAALGALDGDKKSPKWIEPPAFGGALAATLAGHKDAQLAVLYKVQAHLHEIGYPKTADGKENVSQQWFKMLYTFDVIEEDAFEAWRDEDDEGEHPGDKIKVLTQTTEWFAWLEEAEEEDDED